MKSQLENILEIAKTNNRLEVSDSNHRMYINFLRREKIRNSHYFGTNYREKKKKLFLDLLVDKVLMFSYLMRQTKVVESRFNSKETYIDTDDKLHLMRSRSESVFWEDSNLSQIAGRRNGVSSKNKSLRKYLPTYTELINEIGGHPLVVKLWGRVLTYDNDFQQYVRKSTQRNRGRDYLEDMHSRYGFFSFRQ